MAVDYFLKLSDISGESTDNKHKGEIEIESFSWGETQPMSAVGGASTGKVQFQDFHFTSRVSKASPVLFLKCASGEHIKTAVLTARKAGQTQLEFLKVTLSDVLVSSYQSGGSAGSDTVPTDQFALNFAKVEYEYVPQKADGSADASVTVGWDLKANRRG